MAHVLILESNDSHNGVIELLVAQRKSDRGQRLQAIVDLRNNMKWPIPLSLYNELVQRVGNVEMREDKVIVTL